MHACMAILYTLWTEHAKTQAIHALKRQKNTKKCQKYHEKCEKIPVLRGQNREKNSIFDIPLVLSVFIFLVTFWKFSCNWPRHWAREDFFYCPTLCMRMGLTTKWRCVKSRFHFKREKIQVVLRLKPYSSAFQPYHFHGFCSSYHWVRGDWS